MSMHYVRRGAGKPLLLLHGIGGSWRSWQTILEDLATARDVIAVDLPGFGDTPPLEGPVTIATLADAVTAFLKEHDLLGIDAVGSSMGARLVLELARRGALGAVVSLDPGGFWQGWEKPVFYQSVRLSTKLVRALQPVMSALTGNAVTRTPAACAAATSWAPGSANAARPASEIRPRSWPASAGASSATVASAPSMSPPLATRPRRTTRGIGTRARWEQSWPPE